MQAFSNENIKDNLCGGCDCTGFVPDLAYTYDAEAKSITVTDNTTYPDGDSRKVVHISVHDESNPHVNASIAAGDGDDAVTFSVASLDDSDGLKMLATVVTDKGCLSDGHAWNLKAAGSFGKWDKDYDSLTVGADDSAS